MTLTSLIQFVTSLIGLTIPIAAALALFAFLWGILRGFGKMESVDKRTEARQMILWALVALFVVVTLGGIIAVFTSTFPDLRPR